MRGLRRWTAIAAASLLPASMAWAVQPDSPETQPALEQFRTMVAAMRSTLLRPGERVPGWNVGGADPDSDLRARGADRHYLLSSGADGDSVSILTSRPIAELAPADWRAVDSYGSSATPLAAPQVDFAALSPRYVLAVRAQFERRGGVDCTQGITNALLYEVPDAPAAEDDETVPLLFRALILALEGQELCVRSDGDPARGYRSRVFLPDGRPLPEMSDDDVTTIVPAAPVDRLVVWRRPAPAATGDSIYLSLAPATVPSCPIR